MPGMGINRGYRGTYAGVWDEHKHGLRTLKTRRNVRTSESRDSTPPLLLSSCEAYYIYTKKTHYRKKKFVSPSLPFYVLRCVGSASLVLLYFIIRLLTS